MQSYTKTNWVVDVTKVNPTNMNKIENQLETITNELITPTHTHSQYLTQHQDISGKLDTSKVKNVNSTTAGDVYDVTYFNATINSAMNIVGDLNDLTTTEKSDLVGAINEVASSSGETFYLGDVDDYSSSNPLDITLLKKAQYLISNRKNRTDLYLKFTYNNHEVTKSFYLDTPTANYQLILNMYSVVEDFVGYDTLFKICYIYINSSSCEISAKGISADFNTSNYEIVLSTEYTRLYVVTTNTSQTITGAKTFSVLPQSSVVPSSDNQLTNKKYVDDSITTAIGSINTVLATLTTPSNGGGN